jgi:hypothetical protein
VALAHGRSTPGSENGRFWGEEAILRPFLHWQCQLGTVPYTVLYFTVITVKYGVTITVVRRNLTSTVRTVQTVIVPYRTTRQAWMVCDPQDVEHDNYDVKYENNVLPIPEFYSKLPFTFLLVCLRLWQAKVCGRAQGAICIPEPGLLHRRPNQL